MTRQLQRAVLQVAILAVVAGCFMQVPTTPESKPSTTKKKTTKPSASPSASPSAVTTSPVPSAPVPTPDRPVSPQPSTSVAPSASPSSPAPLQPGVSVLAGSDQGMTNGLGAAAQFNSPNGIAIDVNGNVYVADAGNHCIRKVTAGGLVSILAGSTEGNKNDTGTAAQFKTPYGLAVDKDGFVYVADTGNHMIRKISPSGVVTTLAGSGVAGFEDGEDDEATFKSPFSLDLDSAGNLYVADAGNHAIRKVTREGKVETLAGGAPGYVDGPLAEARFFVPNDLAVGDNNILYVADYSNHCVRKLDLAAAMASTWAGNGAKGDANGTGTDAQFNSPTGLAWDGKGLLYVADNLNHRIRKIDRNRNVFTVTGADAGSAVGDYASARFRGPTDVTVDAKGNVYVADTDNHQIKKIR